MDSTDSALTGDNQNRIALKISAITAPDWGFERTESDSDLEWDDHSDEDVFDEYDYWSDRFNVYLID